MTRWEIGSEFDWSERFLKTVDAENERAWLPPNLELFSTGTSCLFALHRSLQDPPRRIHLPSFYCMDVALRLMKIFEVRWYHDLPTEPHADFDSIDCRAGDLVMAFNLFGLREQAAWQHWKSDHEDILVLEDHSHDPISDWARESTADYAFASLRKTQPIPDGGMLWSPKQLPITPAWGVEMPGASLRLNAMRLKHRYLAGEDIEKAQYRTLEIASHKNMGYECDNLVSNFTAIHLRLLDFAKLRARKAANIRTFLDLARARPCPDWAPLFTNWPASSVPLNALIVCKDTAIRDKLRAELIAENIFTAIHWIQPEHGISSGDQETIELTQRILTIPLDARYDTDDVRKVFSKMIH